MLIEKQFKIIKRAERSDSHMVGSYERPTSVLNHCEKAKRDAISVVAREAGAVLSAA